MLHSPAASDRLYPALFLAALFHAVLILGVSFHSPLPKPHEALEITLAHTPAKLAPKQADYLAQADQIGGGSNQRKALPQEAAATGGRPRAAERPAKQQPALAPAAKAPHKAATAPAKPAPPAEPAPEPAKPKIDMAAVEQQIADVSSAIAQARENYAKQSKTLYINSVSTHKYAAAAYEKAWQDKIERVGNLNYPDEARRKNLSGSLLLSVGVDRDGRIRSIKIRQSSGQAVLDDAARNIVQLAAPFAPFPPGLAEEAEVLVITRTWKFFSDSHLATEP